MPPSRSFERRASDRCGVFLLTDRERRGLHHAEAGEVQPSHEAGDLGRHDRRISVPLAQTAAPPGASDLIINSFTLFKGGSSDADESAKTTCVNHGRSALPHLGAQRNVCPAREPRRSQLVHLRISPVVNESEAKMN